MSVAKGDRGRTADNLETARVLKGLCVYTIQICKNEKNFPKRDRWLLTQPIVKCAVNAYAQARKANSIRVTTEDDYRLRRRYQTKAKANLEALLGLIEIAYDGLSLDGERVAYWTRCVMEAERLMSAWKASDRKRFRKIQEDDPAGNGDRTSGDPL